MKQSRIKIVVSYILLLYFIGFVVPPVSAILPASASAGLSGQFLQETRKNNDGLMLIDLAIWESLNRTKRNDEQAERFTTDNPGFSDPQCYDIATSPVEALFIAQEVKTRRLKNVFHYTNNPRSTRSGLAPPLAS